jgi:cytoskeleton protein RodZ
VGEFGDKFRKAREKKDISLDDVSNITKIGSRMLQAIEEEHFDLLPGGVFNKGFIRAYAKHLGLNDEEAITDYLACLRQAQIDAHEVWEPERPAQTRPAIPERRRSVEPNKAAVKSQSPAQIPAQIDELPELQLPRAEHVRPSRKDFSGNFNLEIPWRILAIAAVVVVLAVILWIRRSHSAATASASISPATPEATTAASPVPPAAPINRRSNSVPASSTAPGASQSAPSLEPPQTAQSSTSKHPSAAAPAKPSTPASAGGADENDVTIRTSNQPVSTSSAKSTAPLTLVIRATETSWIAILADGQSVSKETLIAPAHASVRATHEIVARIGNAAGVTFLWNGQEIPADGAEAEVKTFVFDANGMRVVPSAQFPLLDH